MSFRMLICWYPDLVRHISSGVQCRTPYPEVVWPCWGEEAVLLEHRSQGPPPDMNNRSHWHQSQGTLSWRERWWFNFHILRLICGERHLDLSEFGWFVWVWLWDCELKMSISKLPKCRSRNHVSSSPLVVIPQSFPAPFEWLLRNRMTDSQPTPEEFFTWFLFERGCYDLMSHTKTHRWGYFNGFVHHFWSEGRHLKKYPT